MSDKQKAILLMLASTMSMSVMQIMVKLSSGSIPTMQQVFFRNLITLFLGLALIIKSKVPPLGHREDRPKLLARSLFGFFGVASYFYATSHMNVADASLLSNSSPFFSILLSAAFLHQGITRVQLGALVIAFTGALMVIEPSFDMNMLPALLCISSAAFTSISYIIINSLKGKESNAIIVFNFSLVSCSLSLILGFRDFVMPVGWEWAMVLSIGFFAGIGQLLLTQAFKMAPPSEVNIISYMGMICSAILGYFILHERVGIKSLIGMALIITAALLLYFIKSSKEVVKSRVSTTTE